MFSLFTLPYAIAVVVAMATGPEVSSPEPEQLRKPPMVQYVPSGKPIKIPPKKD